MPCTSGVGVSLQLQIANAGVVPNAAAVKAIVRELADQRNLYRITDKAQRQGQGAFGTGRVTMRYCTSSKDGLWPNCTALGTKLLPRQALAEHAHTEGCFGTLEPHATSTRASAREGGA